MPEFPADFPEPSWLDVQIGAPMGAIQVSQFDVGPPARRRRTTAARQPVELKFSPVSAAQITNFEVWFREDLSHGVERFTMAHPVSGAPAEFVFSAEDAYSITPISRTAYEITMTMELIA